MLFVIVWLPSSPGMAEESSQLNVDAYHINPDNPYPSTDLSTLIPCNNSVTSVSNIDAYWGGDMVLGCDYDFVMLHYYGYITWPTSETVTFYNASDDGFYMTINNETIIHDWNLKPCSGQNGSFTFEAGKQYPIDVWFYEYGGGACNSLYYLVNDNWEVVPSSVFSTSITPTPTPTPTIEPTPEPTPTIEPTVEPTPEPTIEPTPEPTVEPSSTPTPKPTPTITPTVSPSPTAAPEPPIRPTPEPILEPTTIQEKAQAELEERAITNDTNILPYTVADVTTELQAEEVLATITNPEAIAGTIGESLQETTEFIGELFTDPAATISAVAENVSKAGLDMTDDQREKAQEVIIPVVIVASVVSSLIGRIK